jgi:hypothetical protein
MAETNARVKVRGRRPGRPAMTRKQDEAPQKKKTKEEDDDEEEEELINEAGIRTIDEPWIDVIG